MPSRSDAMSFSQIVRAVFEKKAKNRKSGKKDVKFTLFWAMSRTPQGYLGHKFGIAECPIVSTGSFREITKKAVFRKKMRKNVTNSILKVFFRVLLKKRHQ